MKKTAILHTTDVVSMQAGTAIATSELGLAPTPVHVHVHVHIHTPQRCAYK